VEIQTIITVSGTILGSNGIVALISWVRSRGETKLTADQSIRADLRGMLQEERAALQNERQDHQDCLSRVATVQSEMSEVRTSLSILESRFQDHMEICPLQRNPVVP
jgi:hypothetical protein